MLVEKNNNTKKTPTNDCRMQISAYSMQGRRCHMEDYFDIGYLMKPVHLQRPNEWPYEYFYLGVFDGHGGSHAASFAKENLLKFITKQKKFWSNNDDDVLAAITKGFAETHEAMLDDMPNWTRANRLLPSTAGTTASILFIRNGKFYTGHVGDSRIVISSEHPDTKNWRSEELTRDHKPENEIERIESLGGQVKAKLGVHRVVWRRPVLCKEVEEKLTAEPQHPCYDVVLGSVASYPIDDSVVDSYQLIPFLAIARSLGDFWSYNPDNCEYIVSPEPDVMCRPITKQDKCILLATDGLWNVVNSSQAIRFLQELKIVKKGERNDKQYSDTYFATDNFYDVSSADDENHALSLVYMAYQIWERRRLRSDNITAIVAMLSDILTPQRDEPTNQTTDNNLKAYTPEYVSANTFRLGQTRIVCQDISLNQKPTFDLKPDDSSECVMLRNLEEYLLFPPSIIDSKSYHPFVRPPRNYFRLSNAKCRKIQREEDVKYDEWIYVKQTSDDPGDMIRLPTRKNKKEVEIRDSSSQATQTMHDFGQPWDQLVNDVKREMVKTGTSMEEPKLKTMYICAKDSKNSSIDHSGDDSVEDDDGTELVFAHELEDYSDSDNTELVFAHELDDYDPSDEDEEEDYDEEGADDQEFDYIDLSDYGSSDEEEEDEDELIEASISAVVDSLKHSKKRSKKNDSSPDDNNDTSDEDMNEMLDKYKLYKSSDARSNKDDTAANNDQPIDTTLEQVLSVVSENRTPVTRRSTRKSATENPKRKLEVEISESPKTKRRKSHPVHTVAAVTQGAQSRISNSRAIPEEIFDLKLQSSIKYQ